MNEKVYIVTTGSYSDCEIDSVWLTKEEAEARAEVAGAGSIYGSVCVKEYEVGVVGRFEEYRGIHCAVHVTVMGDAQYEGSTFDEVGHLVNKDGHFRCVMSGVVNENDAIHRAKELWRTTEVQHKVQKNYAAWIKREEKRILGE